MNNNEQLLRVTIPRRVARPTQSGSAARHSQFQHRACLLVLCLVVGVLVPTPVLAHVKWFEDPSAHPLRTDLILSQRTLLWLATSAAAVASLYMLQRLVGSRDWPYLTYFKRMAVGAPTVLAIQAAIGLVSSATQSALLVPNLTLPAGMLGLSLAAAQVVIALSFVTGIADWVGALALIALVPAAALLLSTPLDALEQALWVGIGGVILVIGRSAATGTSARPWFDRRGADWDRRAIAVLRVAAGISLIAVALDEKLWNPELGRAFLEHRPEFNVFQGVLGWPWFTDDLLVVVVGLTEAAIGAMLISGMLPRLVILVMWAPFHLAIPFLPPQELLGHLPIFGIMYVLFVHGPGRMPGRAFRARHLVEHLGWTPARGRVASPLPVGQGKLMASDAVWNAGSKPLDGGRRPRELAGAGSAAANLVHEHQVDHPSRPVDAEAEQFV